MEIHWLLYSAFFVVWQSALAAFILSVRGHGWRLNLRLLFAFVAIVALIIGAVVSVVRIENAKI